MGGGSGFEGLGFEPSWVGTRVGWAVLGIDYSVLVSIPKKSFCPGECVIAIGEYFGIDTQSIENSGLGIV